MPPAADFDIMEQQLVQYLEQLWYEGESKGYAADALSGVQHFLNSRRRFAGAWQLLTTWSRLEIPCRAPPFTLPIVLALAGIAWSERLYDIAALLLTGFHCCLRTGEILNLRYTDISLDVTGRGAISLPWTKIGQQRGVREVVTIDEGLVGLALILGRADRDPTSLYLACSPAVFRSFLQQSLQKLHLGSCNFQAYSLRRGGATHHYLQHQNVQTTMIRGRWSDVRTARLYLTDGQAALTSLHLATEAARAIAYHSDYLCRELNK